MKKTNVVIASVLKPVDDTRMYEKFARTLSGLPGYHIHIIGFHSSHIPAEQKISFYPVFNFTRLSIKRFVASWNYYKILRKVKPEVIIVNTTDLLIVTCSYKIIFGSKILYDVQENYMYNSFYLKKFRRPLNYVIGYFLRVIEWISSPFISHYILAEQTYLKELPFVGKKFSVIENKFVPPNVEISIPHPQQRKRSIFHLLYSGTIAEAYGIFEAINLVVRLHAVDSRFHLTIIGYCADANMFAKLMEAIVPYSFIKLIGGNRLVPHSGIIQAIKMADVGIISYQFNKSTVNKIPTKLNEYMYYDLPIILPPNNLWKAYCDPFRSYVEYDFYEANVYKLIINLINYSFYSFSISKSALLWVEEKSKLIRLVQSYNDNKVSKI